MHKKKLLLLPLLLLFSFALVSCSRVTSTTQTTTQSTTLTTEPIVSDTHIEVKRYPFKTVYQIGEDLNYFGLIVQVVQSNGITIPLSLEAMSFEGYDKFKSGFQVITVKYNTFETTFAVYVKEVVQSLNMVLQLTPPTKTTYIKGESFDLEGMVVVLIGLDESQIILSPSHYSISNPNMNQLGEQTVAVTALGLREIFTIEIIAPTDQVPITMPYYQTISGLVGQELVLELRTILNTGLTRKTYDDARVILPISDRDPQNSNNLILVYLGLSVTALWDGAVTWNREHVWPQSLLGVSTNGSSRHVGSDLHNLKPANPSENSSRGNRFYASVAVSGVSYTPRAAVRGDIARILFYMVIMYDYLQLIDVAPGQALPVYRMAMLSVLLQWHEEDPVDDFERNRNQVIFSYQNNRNPFIDYPHLVPLIWTS